MSKPSIFFAIAVYRYYEPEAQKSLQDQIAQSEYAKSGTRFELWEQSNLCVARNFLMKQFLEKSKDDYFFMFDVDIACFTDKALDLLVDEDKDIIAAPYIFKKHPFNPTFVAFDVKDYDLRNKKETFEVKYVSGGFTLVRRNVLQKLSDLYDTPFNTYRNKEGDYLSEDWAFCEKARENGFKCWIRPDIVLGHLGKYAYSMLDFYQMYFDNPAVKEFKVQGQLYKK